MHTHISHFCSAPDPRSLRLVLHKCPAGPLDSTWLILSRHHLWVCFFLSPSPVRQSVGTHGI